MAQIAHLQIFNFRNLLVIDIKPAAHFNIFFGNNGAGKTSLLEAIYYFSFGRSFRTNNANCLVHQDHNKFSLHQQLHTSNNTFSIGIERSTCGDRLLRLNKKNVKSIATIAEILPIQFICSNSYRLFHDGPKSRRQLLNWGLFHVEPSYFSLWQAFSRLLKQRNAALKEKLVQSEVTIWTKNFIEMSQQIDSLRQHYTNQLNPIFKKLVAALLNQMPLALKYNPGWNTSQSLEAILRQNFFKDQALGYTSAGPHRADLQLVLETTPARDKLSQGQQKLAAYALLLAQGLLLHDIAGKSPIYLIDDLPSELDPEKKLCITSVLSQLNAQVFITGVTLEELQGTVSLTDAHLFHVKHNNVWRYPEQQH